MLEAAGWALAGLVAEHGAKTAYRVTRERGQVWLEGRSGRRHLPAAKRISGCGRRHLLASPPALAPAFQLSRPQLLTEGSDGAARYAMVEA